jgi:catechol 2,3-dioxygenase-like lactoylglutathione lyase family enzyme
MISDLGSVAVLVRDAKRSAEWYRDKLGFEIVVQDDHIVFVKPKNSSVLIHLCEKCDDWGTDSPGGRTGIWFRSGALLMQKDPKSRVVTPASDPVEVERTYAYLKEKGVEFTQGLETRSWGKMAIFKDLDGNEFEIS